MVSQSVRQGTVAPTHYNVIHDTTQLKPDHMQRLAYKLCHLYYNWPVGNLTAVLLMLLMHQITCNMWLVMVIMMLKIRVAQCAKL